MTRTVQKLVSVGDIAREAGWRYLRMLRHLQRLDAEVGGTLLIRSGRGSLTRYSLTLANLQKVRAGWMAERGEAVDDEEAEALGEQVRELGDLVKALGRAVSAVAKRVEVLEHDRRRRG